MKRKAVLECAAYLWILLGGAIGCFIAWAMGVKDEEEKK